MNEKLKETTCAAFGFITTAFKSHLKNGDYAPFKYDLIITDFENKKDYRLTLELKEVKK